MSSDEVLHEQELAFFGKITASISHELNNVLSIINEYTGLLNDLCSAVKNDTSLEADKIHKISINMREQIKREQKLIKLLNRFAHRFDAPSVSFDLNELVNDIYLISLRFASMKKVSIEFTPPEGMIRMVNNPYRIQFVIFSCLQLALNDSETNDSIRMNLQKIKSDSILNISSRYKDASEDQNKISELISSLLNLIKGKIDYEVSNDHLRIIKLFLPLSMEV